MSEVSPVQYTEITRVARDPLDIEFAPTVIRWVGIADKRRPNTKKPCFIRVKTVLVNDPIFACKDGAIVVRKELLDRIFEKMNKSIAGMVAMSFIDGKKAKEDGVLTLEKLLEAKRLIRFVSKEMRYDDGFPKPMPILSDSVDAVRYAIGQRFGWGGVIKNDAPFFPNLGGDS